MKTTLLRIFENGIIAAPNLEIPEYVKLFLNIENDTFVRVSCKVKQNNDWSAKINNKLPIDYKELKSVFPSFDIDLDYIDDARTTPRYAKNYNRVMQKILKCDSIASYADGYNFIGDAFINFVIAVAIYHKFPNKDTDTLTRYAQIYKNNKYISAVNIGSGWSKYLDKETFDHKTLAGSYKGLIGAIYKSNDPSRLLDIMEYLNKEIIPDSKISFNNHTSHYTTLFYILGGFTLGVMFSTCLFSLI